MAENTGKNAYEIRAEILHLAQQIVSQNAMARFQSTAVQTASGTQMGEWEGFSADDVVKTAEKLYEFVGSRR